MMFCKHDFEIIDKTILASGWEQMGSRVGQAEGTMQMFVKKVVILLKCSKCKEVKKITESNP